MGHTQEVASAALPVLRTRLHRLVAFQEMSFARLAPMSGLAGVPKTSGRAEGEPVIQFSLSAAQKPAQA